MSITEAKSSGEVEAGQPVFRKLLVEMDYVLIDGQQTALSAAREALAQEEVDLELDPALFSRALAGRPPARGFSLLASITDKRIDASACARATNEAIRERLASGSTPARKNVVKALQDLREDGVCPAFVTRLDEDNARAMLDEMKLADDETVIVSTQPDRLTGCGIENWKPFPGLLRVNARRCVALVGSGNSAKSAIAVDMQAVVLRQDLTDFQDAGGANRVLREPTASELREALLETVSL